MIELPATAARRNLGIRDGFEVLFLCRGPKGYQLHRYSIAIEE
jgi:hypothetical protein